MARAVANEGISSEDGDVVDSELVVEIKSCVWQQLISRPKYIQSSSNNGDHSLSVDLFPTHSRCNHLSPHEYLKCAESTFHSFVCSFIHPPPPASNIRACLVAIFEGLASTPLPPHPARSTSRAYTFPQSRTSQLNGGESALDHFHDLSAV